MYTQHGWSIARRSGTRPWHAYKRDSPAPREMDDDTFHSRRAAEEECRIRNKELGFGAVLGETTKR